MDFLSAGGSFSTHSPATAFSSAAKTGRRSYKKIPSKSRRDGAKEAVWPPELEEALLEGLRAYRPVSKTGRPLLRFTKRNCFIADYIKNQTSQSRTPKQVGSRLQQITESCKDAELIRLITNRDLQLHPAPDNASTDASKINDTPCSSVSSKPFKLSMSPTPATTPALSPSSSISDLDSQEVWPPRSSPEYTDNVSWHMSLNHLDEIDNGPLGLGLTANICDDDTILMLTIDHQRKNDARRRLIIPSHSLFDRAPELSIASTLLLPGISYLFSVSVYFDSEFIHSEGGEVIAVKEEYPSEICTLRTALLLNDNWQKVIRSGGEIERYTIILGVMDTSLGTRRHLFSVNIGLKPTSEAVSLQPSPTAFYPNLFEGPVTSHDFPDFSDHIYPTSALPEFTLQSNSDFQTAAAMPSWNVHDQFIPTAAFVPYAAFEDANFITNPDPSLPPWFSQM